MSLETPAMAKLWIDLKGLEKTVLAALDETLVHLPSKRALVIAGSRVQEAWLRPTEGNITKAAEALEQAGEVYARVTAFARGKLPFVVVGEPMERIESAYVRDFPQSALAAAIRERPDYVSF